jgi:hypothetical protein
MVKLTCICFSSFYSCTADDRATAYASDLPANQFSIQILLEVTELLRMRKTCLYLPQQLSILVLLEVTEVLRMRQTCLYLPQQFSTLVLVVEIATACEAS